MVIRRKMFLGFIVTIMTLVILAACSSNDAEETSTDDVGENSNDDASTEEVEVVESEAFEDVTLTLQMGNNTIMDGYDAVFKEIEEKYNIKTEVDLVPGGTEGDNLIKTRLATGELPDIAAYNSGSLFQALNPEEHFLDLTDEPFMDKVEDSFKDVVTIENRVYGIPSGPSSAGGWLYNKKIYEELGLSVPNTWDELMANNRKIKDAGKTAVIGSYQETYTSQYIILADYYNVHSEMPSFAEEYTNNQAKFFDTPIALKGFEKLQQIHDENLMNDDLNSVSIDDALIMLVEGEGVHYPGATSLVTNIKSNYPDKVDDIGFFGQPGDDPNDHGSTLWMPGGFYFNKDIEHFEAALKWAEYFVSEEGMTTFMEHQEPQGPYMIKGIDLPEDVAPMVKDVESYLENDKVIPALEFFSPIKGPNLEQILIEVGLGIISAEEGAEKYDRDVVKQAQQLGLEGW